MKTILKFCILIIFALISQKSSSQIIVFPDVSLKNLLLSANPTNIIARDVNNNAMTIDTNADNEIEVSEALLVYKLNLVGTGLPSFPGTNTNLSGIENFTNLTWLDCSYNPITSLSITALTNLKELRFNRTNVTSFNCSSHPSIEIIYCSNTMLTNLDVSHCPNLNFIDCYDNQITTFLFYDCALLSFIECSFNNITDGVYITQLPMLTTFRAAFSNISTIVALDAPNLQSLQLHNNNISIFQNNYNLPNPYLGVNLSNNQFVNLDLSSYSFASVSCDNNPNLLNLNIKNGINDAISFSNCPNLNLICIDQNEQAAIDASILSNGYTSCNANSYCTAFPSGVFYTITGENKFDANSDGCDFTDNLYQNLKLEISDGVSITNFITDATGYYSHFVPAGNYTITPLVENPGYFIGSASSGVASFPIDSNPSVQNFCFIPSGIHNDLEVLIIPVNDAIPGFTANYKIIYKNKGTSTQSGDVKLDFDSLKLNHVTSSPTPVSLIANQLTWSFISLLPFETREIMLSFQVHTPTETNPTNNGDLLVFTTNVVSLEIDETPSDNLFSFDQTVVGSYDPNDITCLEGTTILPENVGDYVHYLIRFENTGTFNAQNIVVKDVIDTTKYDINSLVSLNGSHSFVSRISNGNTVEFMFNMINLPFDDANNDGFVVFKIKTLSSLALGDTFATNAAIFFDFNYPIITNTYNTTISASPSCTTPLTPTFSAIAPICSGTTISPLPTTSTNGINGTWLPSFNGSATTTYTFTPNVGQCANPTNLTIIVSDTIVPTFSVTSTVCYETTVSPLPTSSTNGITGSWTPAWSTPSIGSVATQTYQFVPDSGQCLDTLTTYFLTLPVTEIIPTFNQVAPICSGAILQPLPTTSTNGITGTWSPALNNTITTNYTFTPDAGQCAFSVNMTISVTSNGPITTSYSVCEGETVVGGLVSSLSGTFTSSVSGDTTGAPTFNRPYSTTASNGMSFGVITCTNSVMVGEATNYVTHNFTAPVSGSYTFTTCGNSTWDTFLALYQAPFNPSGLCAGNTLVMSGDDSICGLQTTMTANLVAGTTYILVVCGYSTPNFGAYSVIITSPTTPTVEWYTTPTGGTAIGAGSPFNPVGVSGSGITDTNVVGVTSFYAQYPGEACRTETLFEVNPPVTPIFSPIAPICLGDILPVLPTISQNNITGTWSPALNNLATTTYTFIPNAGQCATNFAMTITVNPISTNTTTLMACDSYTWAANGQTYTTSGTYTVTTGCTSEVLILTIQPLITWYLDADNDGYGTGLTTVTSCTQPTGYVASSTDCNDANAAIHPGAIDICLDGIDNDCNGIIDNVGQPGGCVPITTNVVNATCGSTVTNLAVTIAANWISGATQYRFRIKNLLTGVITIVDRPINSFALINMLGVTLDTPYEIDVAVMIGGVWQPFYGTPCYVTTPNPVSTIGAQCNTTLTSMTQFVYCTFVTSALGYRFKVTNTVTGAVVIYDNVNNKFNFSLIAGSTFNTLYTVEVALQNTDGTYLAYNTACNITTPPYPTTQLIATQCSGFTPTNGSQFIYCNAVPGATMYQFRLFDGTTYTMPFQNNMNRFKLSNFTGLVPSTSYFVEVAVKMPNEANFGPYGSMCKILAPAVFRVNVTYKANLFKAIAYPNPFVSSFLLDVKTSSESKVQVKVYDMSGKLLEDKSVDNKDLSVLEIGADYPSGVYNVIVSQDDNYNTLRVIKK